MFLSCILWGAVRSIQLQTGGENHGNICKVRSRYLDYGFRIGCDIHGACRASAPQLWRLTWMMMIKIN